MIIRQISVFVENRRGRLAEISRILADAQINIRALSLADTTNFGVLRIIVNDTDKAAEVLRKNNLTVAVNHVVAVRIGDVPGAMADILELLAGQNITVEYAYAFISKEEDKAGLVLRVGGECHEAAELLTAKGYTGLEV